MQRRRFHLGVRNLATLYRPLLDHCRFYDNTRDHPRLVAEEKDGAMAVADDARLDFIERVASVSFMPQASEHPLLEEPAEFSSDEETRHSMRAMRMACADAVLKNLHFGLPIIQEHDGQIVEVPAEALAPLARRILAADGEPLPEEMSARPAFLGRHG